MRILRVPSVNRKIKINSLSIHQDSNTLASAVNDGIIQLWDSKTLIDVTALESPTQEDISKVKPKDSINIHDGIEILSIKFINEWLISGDIKGKVFKTNIKTLKSTLLLESTSAINDITNSANVLFFGTLNKILSFDLDTSKQMDSIPSRSDVQSISVDPTNSYLMSIGFNRQLSIYHFTHFQNQILYKKLPTGNQNLSSINEICKNSWNSIGDLIAVPNFGCDPQVSSIGIVSRQQWKSNYSLYGHNCNVVKFNPNIYQDSKNQIFNIIASSGIDKSIAVWNTTHQRPIFTATDVSEKTINDLLWNGDGLGLFVATDTILIFQFDNGELGDLINEDKLIELKKKINIPDPLKPKEPKPESIIDSNNKDNNNQQQNQPKQPTPQSLKPSPSPQPTKSSDAQVIQHPLTTKTKDGKKRIAPTLISTVNGSKPTFTNTPQIPTNGILNNNNNNHNNTTMEFDEPSYSVPKDLKRKEEFDSDQQKKRREVEAVEFIGSIIINPSTSFSKVRISTPKARSFIQFKSINDDSLMLEIRNGNGNEQKPTKITLFKNETRTIFTDFIPKLAGLVAGGEGYFWAVSTMDGVLYIYSDSGRRIFPPIILGTPLSFLESKGKYLLAVTSIGEVLAWDIEAKKSLFDPTTLYPILSRSNPDLLTRAENLTLCGISSSGTPIVTISNGNGYLFDKDMETWTLVSDSWWAFGSQYWDSRDDKSNGNIVNLLERKTNDEIVRRGRGKFLQKMAKTMLMKEGYENLEKIVSLAHLENRILISKKLNESTEFKNYLIIYCKRISEMEFKAKLVEIFKELYGPEINQQNQEKWDSKILNFDKHELLKEIIFACANIRSVQRILVQFATSLGILDQMTL
ncbi:hypothetical protein BN7_3368 [Wickerhamomyces ciferrii]|uniref:Protein HIR n=1 Tax=Wickerhamomyces ciferrii (strain ATCC 14091 / BCRC 22168 / CBS 111 / JCM 3599 / NBRC 0793 / NRRL Y-1031 F-60-10) TaxID=1206466 RepID=K0KRC0_WICCF|nr:uncharacterized protein BN7_3368 [Wickerhamomyces ciferrii]CCH43814.1 hypothetical protein BN7_3368 [Wickerhamomyces ciferrii]